MSDYKYTLEVGSKKYHCPGCRKKTFVQYVHTGTRDYVGTEFGRCDRENNCGYHRAPDKAVSPPNPHTKKELPPPKTLFPTPAYIEGIRNTRFTAFHAFASEMLGITKEHLAKWKVYSKWNFTAFVLSNLAGQDVNVKFVAYTVSGKRDKSEKEDGTPNFIPHYLGKSYLRNEKIETDNARLEDWQDYYHFARCFYGEHLWDKTKDTCIVESEKTAVIAAYFFPSVNWLATGGNNGMVSEAFSLFNGYQKRIWNLVDNDTAGITKSKTIQWLDRLAEVRPDKSEILSCNLFANRPAGWDLADEVIEKGYRDEAVFLADLKDAIDCRTEYVIDEKSGEVQVVSKTKEVPVDEKTLRRARQVADRIFESKTNLILNPDLNSIDMLQSIASFGENGRPIAIKIFEAAGLDKETCEATFNIALLNPHKNPNLFFSLAKEAGIETRYIKAARTEAAEGAEGIDANEWQITWPDDMDKQDNFDEFSSRTEVFTYSYLEYKNCIYFAVFENAKRQIGFFKISNFIIRPLYLIKSKTDPKRLFEIKNIFGVKYILDIPAKALVSMTEFQVFCESHGNFLFEGTKQQFTKIKRKLYDNTKDAEEVKMLGWQDEGFYAFANGAYEGKFNKVDDYGIIKHTVIKSETEAEEKYFFIPAMSVIYKDEKDQYDLEKKFIYIKRPDVKFADWAQLFYDTYGENGVIGMSFYIASLFRDHIYSRFKYFPHLFHFGPPGTGKSTMCWSIQYMFGLERKPFMLNSGTPVAFHRTFSQFRNAVVWFDEYNNSIEFKRVQDLKSAYDGAGHVKAEWSATGSGNSNRTNTTPVEASCNISGQELPIADNALFKRCILLQYHQTVFSDGEKERLTKLQKLQEKGLSHITGHLTTFRKKMESDYFRVFDEVEKEILKELDYDPNIESRIVKNMAVIAAAYKVLEKELPWPWNWRKMLDTMVKNIRSQNGLISNAKETNQFWETVEFCINQGTLKEKQDFKIEHKAAIKITIDRKVVDKTWPKPIPILIVRLKQAHPQYMMALRMQGEKKGMDMGSLAHYLSHSPGFIGLVASTRFEEHGKGITSSGYAFEYGYIQEQGFNFDRFEAEVSDEHSKSIF